MQRALFDHVDLVVESIDRSLPLLAGAIGVRGKQAEGGVDRYAPGTHHVAFYAPSREVVDERAAWLRENGGPARARNWPSA